jgi:AraC-like DNA-binding protein
VEVLSVTLTIVAARRLEPLLINCHVVPQSRQSPGSRPSAGPRWRHLTHSEQVEWHDHAEHQLIHPVRGVLNVSTPHGTWVVPSHRAVWIPAGVAHAHRAYGRTQMHSLAFPREVNPLRFDRPTVLAVGPLLREVIVALTETAYWPHDAAPDNESPHNGPPHGEPPRSEPPRNGPLNEGTPPAPRDLTAQERRHLELVALDRLRRVDELPLLLPTPSDPRLRDLDALVRSEPGDRRTLAQLGAAVGASERTLSRLLQRETGMGFARWRTQVRMHHALTLLAAGDSVSAAASACGYISDSSFIAAFRQVFGTTPGRYWAD